jgi:uncharacterized metal-binding protein YceD (DUF177 family)
MHVDVSDLLHEETGSAEFAIAGEQPELEGVHLMSPLTGHIRIVKGDQGLSLDGRLTADVELEFHRCLRSYVHSLTFPVSAEFTDRPGPDEFAIGPDGTLVLDELVRQEMLVHLPQKQLCEAACAGLKI